MKSAYAPRQPVGVTVKSLARTFTVVDLLVRSTLHMDRGESDRTMHAIQIICGYQHRVASTIKSAVELLETNSRPLPGAQSSPEIGLDPGGRMPHGISRQIEVLAKDYAAIRTLVRETPDLAGEKVDQVVHAIEMICVHKSTPARAIAMTVTRLESGEEQPPVASRPALDAVRATCPRGRALPREIAPARAEAPSDVEQSRGPANAISSDVGSPGA